MSEMFDCRIRELEAERDEARMLMTSAQNGWDKANAALRVRDSQLQDANAMLLARGGELKDAQEIIGRLRDERDALRDRLAAFTAANAQDPNASPPPSNASTTTKGQVPGLPGHNPFRDFPKDNRRMGP